MEERHIISSWRAARKGMPLEVGGPPARNFIFQWAGRDHRDHRDHREMASHACAPGHWLDRRHWDNGRLARCVDCQSTASGLPMDVNRPPMVRPCNAQDARCPSKPVPGAKPPPGTIPVVSVVPAVPVAGSCPAKRPCAYPGHRQVPLSREAARAYPARAFPLPQEGRIWYHVRRWKRTHSEGALSPAGQHAPLWAHVAHPHTM